MIATRRVRSACALVIAVAACESFASLPTVVRAAPASALGLALGPWIGADLPTGVPGARRWRLSATGRPGSTVTFATTGLPKHWVASFCTEKFCSPNRYDAVLDPRGTTVVEFQIIPDPETTRAHVTVRIAARDGDAHATTHAVFR